MSEGRFIIVDRELLNREIELANLRHRQALVLAESVPAYKQNVAIHLTRKMVLEKVRDGHYCRVTKRHGKLDKMIESAREWLSRCVKVSQV
jgi:hypothetical protein